MADTASGGVRHHCRRGEPTPAHGHRFAHNVHPLAKVALGAARPFTLSPKNGARSLVHLCSSPDVADLTGSYWSGMKQPALTDAATSDDDARRLWELSASLTGVDL